MPAACRPPPRRYPQARIVPAADQLFTLAPALDLVVVSTPHHTHAPLASGGAGRRLPRGDRQAVRGHRGRGPRAGRARRAPRAAGHPLPEPPLGRRHPDAAAAAAGRRARHGAPLRVALRRWRPTPKPRWTVEGADARGEGLLLDLMVHLVDQALLLFGPARDVYAEFDRRHPQVHVVDDVFLAITHANGVRSHLFTSATVGIGGPRLNVLGSAGAFVKDGMDPQEAWRCSPARRRAAPAGARGRDELGPARRRGRDPGHRRERARRLPALLRRRGARTGDRGAAAGLPPPRPWQRWTCSKPHAFRPASAASSRAPHRRFSSRPAGADPRKLPLGARGPAGDGRQRLPARAPAGEARRELSALPDTPRDGVRDLRRLKLELD